MIYNSQLRFVDPYSQQNKTVGFQAWLLLLAVSAANDYLTTNWSRVLGWASNSDQQQRNN